MSNAPLTLDVFLSKRIGLNPALTASISTKLSDQYGCHDIYAFSGLANFDTCVELRVPTDSIYLLLTELLRERAHLCPTARQVFRSGVRFEPQPVGQDTKESEEEPFCVDEFQPGNRLFLEIPKKNLVYAFPVEERNGGDQHASSSSKAGFLLSQRGFDFVSFANNEHVPRYTRQGTVILKTPLPSHENVFKALFMPSLTFMAIKVLHIGSSAQRALVSDELKILYQHAKTDLVYGELEKAPASDQHIYNDISSGFSELPSTNYLCSFFDAYIDCERGSVNLVSKFYSNGSISDYIEEGTTTFCPEDCSVIAYSVVAALLELHRFKLVHCNVKPSTILVKHDYSLALGNFRTSREEGVEHWSFGKKIPSSRLGVEEYSMIEDHFFAPPENLLKLSRLFSIRDAFNKQFGSMRTFGSNVRITIMSNEPNSVFSSLHAHLARMDKYVVGDWIAHMKDVEMKAHVQGLMDSPDQEIEELLGVPSTKADVWSLGITIMSLFCGRFPWMPSPNSNSTISSTMSKFLGDVTAGKAVPIQINALDPDMFDFLSQCLTLDPTARPDPVSLFNHPLIQRCHKMHQQLPGPNDRLKISTKRRSCATEADIIAIIEAATSWQLEMLEEAENQTRKSAPPPPSINSGDTVESYASSDEPEPNLKLFRYSKDKINWLAVQLRTDPEALQALFELRFSFIDEILHQISSSKKSKNLTNVSSADVLRGDNFHELILDESAARISEIAEGTKGQSFTGDWWSSTRGAAEKPAMMFEETPSAASLLLQRCSSSSFGVYTRDPRKIEETMLSLETPASGFKSTCPVAQAGDPEEKIFIQKQDRGLFCETPELTIPESPLSPAIEA